MSSLSERRVVTTGDAIIVLLVDLCSNLKGERARERDRQTDRRRGRERKTARERTTEGERSNSELADGAMLPEICLHPLVMPPQLWCRAALREHHGTPDDVERDSDPSSR